MILAKELNLTKVLGEVDVNMIMYPNIESVMMDEEEYEQAAISAFIELYYQLYEDFEEIIDD